MKSALFNTDEYKDTKQKIKAFLNAQDEFLSGSTVKSTRAAGDAIQDILSTGFQSIVGNTHCLNYSSDFSRRAMADFAFEDCDKFYYVVDVKTHRSSTKFNRPNLTSVARLARFYGDPKLFNAAQRRQWGEFADDRRYFVILYVGYSIRELRVIVTNVEFVPIEFFDWDCLTLGNLGNCQIQIANANRIVINPRNQRKAWMLELCEKLAKFYPGEIAKIKKRMEFFRREQAFWEKKPTN